MRAVVIERPNEVVFKEVQTPECGSGDVLVRSHKAGVCNERDGVVVGKVLLEHVPG